MEKLQVAERNWHCGYVNGLRSHSVKKNQESSIAADIWETADSPIVSQKVSESKEYRALGKCVWVRAYLYKDMSLTQIKLNLITVFQFNGPAISIFHFINNLNEFVSSKRQSETYSNGVFNKRFDFVVIICECSFLCPSSWTRVANCAKAIYITLFPFITRDMNGLLWHIMHRSILIVIIYVCAVSRHQTYGQNEVKEQPPNSDECQVTPVIHVLQYPGCVPKPIPSFACIGRCSSYLQVSGEEIVFLDTFLSVLRSWDGRWINTSNVLPIIPIAAIALISLCSFCIENKKLWIIRKLWENHSIREFALPHLGFG